MKNRMQNRLGFNALQITISKILTLLVSTITTMVLVRYMSVSEYGTYSALLITVQIVSVLFLFGLPNSINYFLVRAATEEDKRQFISTFFSLITVLGAFMGLILFFCTPLIGEYFHNEDINRYAFFLSCYPWAVVVGSCIDNILVVYNRVKMLVFYRLLNVLIIFGVTMFATLNNWGFDIYLNAFLTVNIFFAVVIYCICYRLCNGFYFTLYSDLIKKIFIFSIPIGLATILGTIDIEFDKLFVGYVLDTEQLGIYSAVSKELPLAIFASAITSVLLPKLTQLIKQGDNELSIALWRDALCVSFMVICFCVVAVVVFSDEILKILYSAKYDAGINIFRIYALALLLRCAYFGIFLNATGKTGYILKSSFIAVVINVVLNPLLFYLFGIIGPAIATVLSMLSLVISQIVFTAKVMQITVTDFIPFKHLSKIFLINVILGGLVCFIKNDIIFDELLYQVLWSISLIVIWCITYGCLFGNSFKQLWHRVNVC